MTVGCAASYKQVRQYASYNKNYDLLKSKKFFNKINFGPFDTAADTHYDSIQCRFNVQIVPPNKKTYADYLRDAFIAEFTRANLYSSSAPIVLSAQINNISLDSLTGIWNISLTINSSNGRSITAHESFSYKAAMDAGAGCFNASFHFIYAVQDLIGKSLLDPNFSLLME